MIDFRNMDCMELMDEMIEDGVKVDLIVTDPPYLIENTTAGGKSKLAKSIQSMNSELKSATNLINGIDDEVLERFAKLQDKINCYIWCNHKQIPQYLRFFVEKLGCKFDILIWEKTNATPLFSNKYLSDKEYCLYFRKGGYCNPKNYAMAHTVFTQPINVKDKAKWLHPTIKPINIIKVLIENSSKEDETVFDPFSGSGTTALASSILKRNFVGCELDEEYYNLAQQRIKEETAQLSLF